jgi:hypothetical protein
MAKAQRAKKSKNSPRIKLGQGGRGRLPAARAAAGIPKMKTKEARYKLAGLTQVVASEPVAGESSPVVEVSLGQE